MVAAAGALSVGAVVAFGWIGLTDHASILLFAAAVAASFMVVGVRRSRKRLGHVDPFHPLLFPLGYVAVSFLMPAWVELVAESGIGRLAAVRLAPETAQLMALGTIGFAVGAAVRFRPPTAIVTGGGAKLLATTGRAVVAIAMLLAVKAYVSGAVVTRGLGQDAYTMADSMTVLLNMAGLTGVLLVLAARRLDHRRRLLSGGDWLVVTLLVLFMAASGRRSAAVAVMLCILVAHAIRDGRFRVRGRAKGALMGGAVIALFAVYVLGYRSEQIGDPTDRSAFEGIVTDLAVATYTTGETARVVPERSPFEYGNTILSAFVRQLPGPVAVVVRGPPTDTGAIRFRELIHYNDPANGFGYSIPAEGYLNFGFAGTFGLCAAVGILAAWAYPRMRFAASHATHLLYPLVVAGLPFGLRSDVLGFGKNVLYPLVAIGLVLLLCRSKSEVELSDGKTTPTRSVSSNGRGARVLRR